MWAYNAIREMGVVHALILQIKSNMKPLHGALTDIEEDSGQVHRFGEGAWIYKKCTVSKSPYVISIFFAP